MTKTPFTVYAADGAIKAGDTALTNDLLDYAEDIGGYITGPNNVVVFESSAITDPDEEQA